MTHGHPAAYAPDWNELPHGVTNHGPKSEERLAFAATTRGDAVGPRTILVRHAPSQRRPPEIPTTTTDRDLDARPMGRRPNVQPWRSSGARRTVTDAPRRLVMAPERSLAATTPASLYGRRQESVALWGSSAEPHPRPRRPGPPPAAASIGPSRRRGGYVMRTSFAAARQQSGPGKPKQDRSRPTRPAKRPTMTTTRSALARPSTPLPRPRSTNCSCRWPTTSSSLASGLRVDRDRPHPRGGHRDELARPGRARGHARALYELLAEVRGTGQTADTIAYDRERPSIATPGCSTTDAAIGR